MKDLKKEISEKREQIDQAHSNSSFCGTSGVNNVTELTKQMAKSLLLGQGDMEDLLNSPGKKVDKKYKNKRGCT